MASKVPKLTRSDLESKLQTKILQWLRKQGAFATKMQQNATTAIGVADIFFCKEGFYGFLEVKKSKTAKRRPGQEAFIKRMGAWSYARVVYPENWKEIREELEGILK